MTPSIVRHALKSLVVTGLIATTAFVPSASVAAQSVDNRDQADFDEVARIGDDLYWLREICALAFAGVQYTVDEGEMLCIDQPTTAFVDDDGEGPTGASLQAKQAALQAQFGGNLVSVQTESFGDEAESAEDLDADVGSDGRFVVFATRAEFYFGAGAASRGDAVERARRVDDAIVEILSRGGPVGPPTGQPLCSQALALLEGFGPDELAQAGITDPLDTDIALDDEFLLADFQLAVRRHNEANPNDQAFSNESFAVGGLADGLWFASDPYVGPPAAVSSYITGKEGELHNRIIQLSQDRKVRGDLEPRLTPGEVFEIALDLNDGDTNQALLTAHNTIRSHARGTEPEYAAQMGISDSRDDAFFNDHLVPVRTHDNSGSWYHLYGTAYMEMAARGDWLPWGTTLAGIGLATTGPVGLFVGGGIAAASAASKVDSDTSGTSGASRMMNALERVIREHASTKNAPDPVEFCFNVWGAQIGRDLYTNLPGRFTPPIFDPPYEGFAPPDVEMPNFDASRTAAKARFLTIVNSPFAIELDAGESRLVFDQTGPGLDQQRYAGYVPGLAIPFEEEDSWGFFYAQPEDVPVEVTLVAIRDDAKIHLTRTDLQSGETVRWADTLPNVGDRYTIRLDDDLIGELRSPSGVVPVTETYTLDLGSVPGERLGGQRTPLLAGIGVAALVGIGAMWMFRRRERVEMPAPPAPRTPTAPPSNVSRWYDDHHSSTSNDVVNSASDDVPKTPDSPESDQWWTT